MDHDSVVSQQAEGGRRLIEALASTEFEVRAAFWAKPTDDGKWFLYLVSSMVDEKGPATAYRFVHETLRNLRDLWIEPLEIRVIGLEDSLAESVRELIKPRVPDSPFSVRNPKPYPGMIHLGGTTLGGVSIDGAYIYPPDADQFNDLRSSRSSSLVNSTRPGCIGRSLMTTG